MAVTDSSLAVADSSTIFSSLAVTDSSRMAVTDSSLARYRYIDCWSAKTAGPWVRCMV